MKPKLNILFILLLLPALLHAQPGNEKRAYHWFFGWNAGLDFSSGSMQEDTQGQVYIDEGACSISDTAGNLLFYAGPNFFTEPGDSNMNVYNANHEVMQNGYDIDCGWSGRQNSIIVPLPESDSIYYLFTIGDIAGIEFGIDQTGFKYSIVDMSLDGGFGAVTDKNIEIYPSSQNDTLSEILTAVHHANCRDVWVMIHRYNADKFLAYKLTANGLVDNPVVSNIGYTGENCVGWGMKFSPNGKYAAVNKNYHYLYNLDLCDTIELYKFNNETGVLSNRIALAMDSALCGKEFSFQNDLLYTEELHTYLLNLYQYDISKWQKSYIIDSKILIGNYFFPMPDLHVTPLNTIAMSGEGDYVDNMGIIANPNVQGLGCSVDTTALEMSTNMGWNFPNFVRSYFNTDTSAYNNCTPFSDEEIIKNQRFEVHPNPLGRKAEINTHHRKIIYYNLYDLKGNQLSKDKDYKLRQNDDAYLFINKKLKGGMYLLSGVFADKGQFNIKLLINN
jgi:hypothetical protein